MAGNTRRQVTYIQFDTSTQSQLLPPYAFALRAIFLSLIVVIITIVTMSALISRDSRQDETYTMSTPVSSNRVLPRELMYKIEYDKLPILSLNSVMNVQVEFEYNSSEPFDAYISLRDLDKKIPEATWRVKDLMTDKFVGFLSTTQQVHVANGSQWKAKYAWFRYSNVHPTSESNGTVSP